MGFIIFIAVYAYSAYTLQTIAKKTKTENEWLAWIPIANLYLLTKIANKSAWWILLLLIPLINLVFSVIIWWKVAEARKKPGWLGFLALIPFLNLVMYGILAFSDESIK